MAQYGYDGATTTYYVYDGSGNPMMEYCGSASSRAKMRCDYTPFGKQIAAYACAGATPGQKFTGKERGDPGSENGLDYFGFRYMSAAQGRFTSPDAPFADQNPADPQSWNLYGYVRNNPLLYGDPTGRACVAAADGDYTDNSLPGPSCEEIAKQDKQRKPSSTVTAYEPPSPELLAVARGTQQAGPVVNAAGYATVGVMGGAFVGAAYGAIAGGSTALSIPVTSGGSATAATYQLLKDSYRNLELVGEALNGVGQRVIAAGDEIRDVARLVSQYGGKASDWVKLSTRGVDPSKLQIYAQQAGRGTPIQMRYYKNIVTGAIVEMKSVFTGITEK